MNPTGNPARWVDPVDGVVAAVAVWVGGVAGEADWVDADPASHGRIIPSVEVVLQARRFVEESARVEELAFYRSYLARDVAVGVVDDVFFGVTISCVSVSILFQF